MLRNHPLLDPAAAPVVTINQGLVPSPAPGEIAVFQNANGEKGVDLQTRFTMQLSQRDLGSIAVAEAEKQIRARIVELQGERRALNATRAELVTAQNAIVDSFVRTKADADIQFTAFKNAAAALGFKLEPVFGAAEHNSRASTLKGKMTARAGTGNGDSLELEITYTDTAPDDFKARLDQIAKIDRDAADLDKRILAARSALSNVDSIERAATAAMAEAVASNTGEQGQRIVAGIKASIKVDNLVEQLAV